MTETKRRQISLTDEQWRKLRNSLSTVDARIKVDVDQPNRTVTCGDGRCERNPASRPETQAMVLERVGAHIGQLMAAQDRETLCCGITKAIGRRISEFVPQTVTQRRHE